MGGLIKKDAVRLVVLGMNTYVYLGTGVKTKCVCMHGKKYINYKKLFWWTTQHTAMSLETWSMFCHSYLSYYTLSSAFIC